MRRGGRGVKKVEKNTDVINGCSPSNFIFFLPANKFLVSFSFVRNWHLLAAPVRKEMRDLRSISAVRIWTMIPIIYGHCSWFTIALPIKNPIYVEQVRVLIIFKFSDGTENQILVELPSPVLHDCHKWRQPRAIVLLHKWLPEQHGLTGLRRQEQSEELYGSC